MPDKPCKSPDCPPECPTIPAREKTVVSIIWLSSGASFVTALALLGPSFCFTVTLFFTDIFFGASFDFITFRMAVLLFTAAFFLAGFLERSFCFTVTLVFIATFFGAFFDSTIFCMAVLLFASAFFLAGFFLMASFLSALACLVGVALLTARRFEPLRFFDVFLLALICAV